MMKKLFYRALKTLPDISYTQRASATQMIVNQGVVQTGYTMEMERYQSGSIYESAVNTVQNAHGTGNILVLDIELKDTEGTPVHQLSDTALVKVDIPSDYNIQPGNTVVVYFLRDDGSLEECKTTYDDTDPDNRYALFETNHFSLYILAEHAVQAEEKEIPEETSDTKEEPQETEPITEEQITEQSNEKSFLGIMIGIILGIIVVSLAVVLLVKKK